MGYLIDTYALIAWFVERNLKYKKYFENPGNSYITPFILMEFYFSVYHDFGEAKAEFLRKIILKNFGMIKIKHSYLIECAKFRSIMYKKRVKISYADSMCYILAKEFKLKVLTGDKHFKDLDHVEYVK